MDYDFGGYATRFDIKCMDGRTIRRDAFKDCDGKVVPLVFNHIHDEPGKVLGHAVLENRKDGVYTYGSFNDTEAGQNARELVRHGDITSLSIYANQLHQKGGDVLHGVIREVSLVLAGANPGAGIDYLAFEHGMEDEEYDVDAIIWSNEMTDMLEIPEDIEHDGMDEDDSEEETEEELEEESEEEEVDEDSEEESEDEYDEEYEDESLEHSAEGNDEEEDTEMANTERTLEDIFNGFDDEQRDAVYFMIGQALEDAEAEHEEEIEEMKHNIFEGDNASNSLSHADIEMIFDDAKRIGSLKETVEEHMANGVLAHSIDTTGMDVPAEYTGTYGVDPIDYLFPEARALSDTPEWIKRDTSWVDKVLAKVHRTPFSRTKSIFANITENEARAKGYVKGNEKTDEVFTLLKRTTTPQTIYKKQKLDRDDVLDITTFDVVAWIKSEMRGMLNEEIARAIFIGDGRLNSSDDKISEDHIRPIATDAPLFTIQASVVKGSSDEATAKNIIKAAIKARKNYKGSGNPVFYTTEDVLTSMLLIEDGFGHFMYKSESELATALRVVDIVTCPVMEGYQIDGNDFYGIIVNLTDYNVGADKGGAINLFDDFDIDFNQQKYLIETRCSGALIKPFSAICLTAAAEEPSDNNG